MSLCYSGKGRTSGACGAQEDAKAMQQATRKRTFAGTAQKTHIEDMQTNLSTIKISYKQCNTCRYVTYDP